MKLVALAVLSFELALIYTHFQPTKAASLLSIFPSLNLLQDILYSFLNSISSSLNRAVSEGTNTDDFFLTNFKVLLGDASIQLDLSSDPDAGRNVSQIIRSRGFEAEEYDVITRDGYILTIQRIINPLVEAGARPLLKPVILQHGLMTSSADWVLKSTGVRPGIWPKRATGEYEIEVNFTNNEQLHDSQELPNSLGFYLANEGHDVFLANSRGNTYGQRHTSLSAWDSKFWAFSFDEQIQYDLPDTIAFVQDLTGKTKLGYVAHSQGSSMMFGLMSEKPEYANIVEPFVALAPVAYVNLCATPFKYLAAFTSIFQSVNMWFVTRNLIVRYFGPIICSLKNARGKTCVDYVFEIYLYIIGLSAGFDEEQIEYERASAYLDHIPSGTSVKNMAHYGQEIINGRFAKFDYGLPANLERYGQEQPPDYNLSKVKSKSIVLFVANNDWVASPPNVARLVADLGTKPFAVFNISEENPKWNHLDFIYAKRAGELVNRKIIGIFEHFKRQYAGENA